MDENAQVGIPAPGASPGAEVDPAGVLPPGPARRGLPRPGGWAARLIVPAALAGLVLAQARLFREATCETYDEFTYLRMGICIYRYGDFRSLASPMCPPLPILLEYGLPALRAGSLPESEGWEREVPGLIRQARLMTSVLVGVPLVGVVYAWLARRRGRAIGALGGGLVALSPSVLAAASIATTDACFVLFAVLALAALRRYQVRPAPGSLAMAGAAMGLALASKQSAAFLVPVATVELLLKAPARRPGSTRVDSCLRTLWWMGTRLAALIALAFAVDWALYGFGLAPRFGRAGTHVTIPVIIPMVADLLPDGEAIMEAVRRLGPPLAIDTFVGQMDHASEGHAAFLMGRYSSHGWWYFFPVAIALKSTPAELLMIGLIVFLACRPGTWREPTRRLWLGSVAVLLGLGIASALNIGHRYMLPIYPLVVLLAADRLGEVAARRPARATALGVLLLAWQAVSAVGIAPHYLSYFNGVRGGPSQGYRYLVDSSLDWGQDLPSLRRELEARGYRKVALCYFGTAKPSVYGLRAMDWMAPEDPVAAGCDWLAISATALQGAYSGSSELSDRFGGLPSARAGYSIFLYDLKDPRVRAALGAGRAPAHPPSRRRAAGPGHGPAAQGRLQSGIGRS
jgi:4-amino-4-deoxy-L-arabinose transferase-like glycosyltransferase